MPFSADDRRYEPYVRPIRVAVAREAQTWRWRGWHVHVEHVGDAAAPVRLLLVHGAGGNAAALWPFAAHIALLGAHVTVLDLPGYGRTRPARSGTVTYGDWQQALLDFVMEMDDSRPLILMGASIGGMLALDTAAVSGRGDLVVATCLLDGTDPSVRRTIVRVPWLAGIAESVLRMLAGPGRGVPIPVRWVTPMRRISNSPGLVAEVLRDRRGGRGTMPLGWFRSFLEAGPAVRPEDYDGPPVLLVHPGQDRWTPTAVSTAFLSRIRSSTRLVVLDGCGHFPVEEPGFQQLLDALGSEVGRLAGRPRS